VRPNFKKRSTVLPITTKHSGPTRPIHSVYEEGLRSLQGEMIGIELKTETDGATQPIPRSLPTFSLIHSALETATTGVCSRDSSGSNRLSLPTSEFYEIHFIMSPRPR